MGSVTQIHTFYEIMGHRQGDIVIIVSIPFRRSIGVPQFGMMTLILTLVINFCFVLNVFCEGVYDLPSSQLLALRDLYDKTDGSNWRWRPAIPRFGYPWNFARSTPCDPYYNWQGLKCRCSSTNCTVVALNLTTFDLRGYLPSSLGNLVQLEVLNFRDNELYGNIPESIGNLSHVRELLLGRNRFEGIIPSALCRLKNIERLTLDRNSFEGTIPSCLGFLNRTKELSLTENQLDGSIPLSLMNLVNLEILYLDNNYFTGSIPMQLGEDFQSLLRLDMSINQFNGTIPSSFGKLGRLESLIIFDCQLTGTLPPELGLLNDLKIVNFVGNKLHGTLPLEWAHLTKLNVAVFSKNQLNGSIPSIFGENLKQLRMFDVSHNLLSGTIPESIYSLPRLRYFSVLNNHLTGTLSSAIGQLSDVINILLLGQNTFHGTVPQEINNLKELVILSISRCNISGALPEFTNLRLLRDLYLGYNSFTGTLPATIGEVVPYLAEFEVESNNLHGSIPESMARLVHLRYAYLNNNNFNGTIPATLLQNRRLSILNLASNRLTGTIPATIGNMTYSIDINFANNSFHGSIPAEVGSLSRLRKLSLYLNKLSGPLPFSIGNLTQLNYLDVSHNQLTGTLPTELRRMQSLRTLYLNDNLFNGTFPAELGELRKLLHLESFGNHYSGQIPESLGNLSDIVKLDLGLNNFNGTIPHSFANLESIISLLLDDNSLSGTFPTFLCTKFPAMKYLLLSSNLLTGTLPLECISTTSNSLLNRTSSVPPALLDLSYNLLTGSISFEVPGASLQSDRVVLHTPKVLLLNGNHFRGPVLQRMPNFTAWESDHYSGMQFEFLNLSSNHFTGTLSANISSMLPLELLDLSSNRFSGSIDGVFASLPKLSTLILSNNNFTGTIPGLLFGGSNGSQAITVDLGNNAFSGSLPSRLFQAGNILSFSASINCFSGVIPDSLCDNPRLTTLLLDGLHASSACSKLLFPRISRVYVQTKNIYGGVPSCLFQMPALKILHLSGNALEGSIENLSFIGNRLSSLVLSHNLLTGTIPESIWRHNFSTLTLSFNRLGGHISPHISTVYSAPNSTASLSLQLNRLSGVLPSTLIHANSINILNGNMFSCDVDRSDLPEHDSEYHTYQCGSANTNTALIAFFSLLVFLFSITVCVWRRETLQRLRQYSFLIRQRIQCLYDVEDSIDNVSYVYLRQLYVCGYHLGWLVIAITFFICVPGLSLYAYLSYAFPTYFEQYVWLVTPSFLSGPIPAITLLCYFLVLIIGILRFDDWLPRVFGIQVTETSHVTPRKDDETTPTEKNDVTGSSDDSIRMRSDTLNTSVRESSMIGSVRRRLTSSFSFSLPSNGYCRKLYVVLHRLIIPIVFNTVVVVAVNFAYVRSFDRGNHSANEIFAISLGLSIFKLLWNDVVVNLGFSQYVRFWLAPYSKQPQHRARTVGLGFPSWAKVFCSVTNNIVAPYLAEGIASSNCFYYAFYLPPTVSALDIGSSCELIEYEQSSKFLALQFLRTHTTAQCGQQSSNYTTYTVLDTYVSTASIDFYPPFQYNFQCTSTLVSAFGYVFVLRYVLSGIVLPLFRFWVKYVQEAALQELQKQRTLRRSSSSFSLSFARRFSRTRESSSTDGRAENVNEANEEDVSTTILLRRFRLATKVLPGLLRPVLTAQHAPTVTNSIITLDVNNEDLQNQVPSRPESERLSSMRAGVRSSSRSSSRRSVFVHQAQMILWRESLHAVFKQHSADVAPNLAHSLRVRLLSDLAVLLTFGVLFPPLGLLVAWSILLELATYLVVLGSLVSQRRRLRLLQLFASSQREPLRSNSVSAAAGPVVSENIPDSKAETDSNARRWEELQRASRRAGAQVEVNETLALLDRLLALWDRCFEDFSPRMRRNITWVVSLGATAWSLTLFDILGDHTGSLHALWIVVLLTTAPTWLGMCFHLARSVHSQAPISEQDTRKTSLSPSTSFTVSATSSGTSGGSSRDADEENISRDQALSGDADVLGDVELGTRGHAQKGDSSPNNHVKKRTSIFSLYPSSSSPTSPTHITTKHNKEVELQDVVSDRTPPTLHTDMNMGDDVVQSVLVS